MTKRRDAHEVILVFVALLAMASALAGCSRNEPPPPPQAGPPGMAMPQTQAPPMQAMPQQQAVPQVTPVQPVAPATGQAMGSYAQVQVGMSSQQVLQLLGNPTKVKPKGQYVEWEYWTGGTKFEIKLQADQVVAIERH